MHGVLGKLEGRGRVVSVNMAKKSAFDRKWVEFLKKSKLSFELLRKLVVKYSPMVVAASLRGIKINTWWLCVIDWIPGRTP